MCVWKCFLFCSWAYGFWILIYVCIKRCVRSYTCFFLFTSCWIYPCRHAVLEQSLHVRLSPSPHPIWVKPAVISPSLVMWFIITTPAERSVLNRLDKVLLKPGYSTTTRLIPNRFMFFMRRTTPGNLNLKQTSEYLRLWIWADLHIHNFRCVQALLSKALSAQVPWEWNQSDFFFVFFLQMLFLRIWSPQPPTFPSKLFFCQKRRHIPTPQEVTLIRTCPPHLEWLPLLLKHWMDLG